MFICRHILETIPTEAAISRLIVGLGISVKRKSKISKEIKVVSTATDILREIKSTSPKLKFVSSKTKDGYF